MQWDLERQRVREEERLKDLHREREKNFLRSQKVAKYIEELEARKAAMQDYSNVHVHGYFTPLPMSHIPGLGQVHRSQLQIIGNQPATTIAQFRNLAPKPSSQGPHSTQYASIQQQHNATHRKVLTPMSAVTSTTSTTQTKVPPIENVMDAIPISLQTTAAKVIKPKSSNEVIELD
jgi:hypothetical protein